MESAIYGKDIAFKEDLIRTASGDFETVEGIANLKEALFRRLVTVPGSLVHRPDYGVGVKLFQNALNSLDNRRKLALRIREQYARDPRVQSINGISIEADDNQEGMIKITVRVQPVGYGEQVMTFTPSI